MLGASAGIKFELNVQKADSQNPDQIPPYTLGLVICFTAISHILKLLRLGWRIGLFESPRCAILSLLCAHMPS